jgi:DNA-binding NarL/FixJ family response regulator
VGLDASAPVLQARREAGSLDLLIVSDVRFLREGLAELLARNPAVRILGQCADLAEAMAANARLRPDIILLDAGFHDAGAVAPWIRDTVPAPFVVALAVADTAENIISWARAGVTGFVPSSTALADLADVLISISRGSQVCSARTASGLLRHLAHADRPPDTAPAQANLTPREIEICQLIGAGMSNKEIARRLHVGLATIKTHVHNLLGKLNVHSRAQVVARMSGQRRSGLRPIEGEAASFSAP